MAELPISSTGEAIAKLANPYTTGLERNYGEADVESYVPVDILSLARASDVGMVRRAMDYPSYIAQLELCGKDGSWLLDDFNQRLSERNIDGSQRQVFLRILRTARDFHEYGFRNRIRSGDQTVSGLCEEDAADVFQKFTVTNADGVTD